MVRCRGGGVVSVLVNEEALPEYDLLVVKEGHITTYTCYVEAKEGEEYQVELEEFPMVKQGYFDSEIWVDGRHADYYVGCAPETLPKRKKLMNGVIFDSFEAGVKNGQTYMRALEFSKMPVTGDAFANMLSAEDLDEVCTIRVDIVQTFREGELRHYKPSGPIEDECCNLTLPPIPQDSKTASYELSTKPGKEKVETRVPFCHCKKVDDPNPKTIIVIFHYRPRRWLVAKGLISAAQGEERDRHEDDDDDDIVIDTGRTERSARLLARRREREEEGAIQSRNVRIKTERQIKAEPSIKTEASV